MATRKRYKDMERVLTLILIGDAAVFLLYMIVAGLGIGWLKVITTIVNLVASIGCLGLLYITGEVKKAYYQKGYKTPKQINPFYAEDQTWYQKINNYMNKLKK